MKLTCSNELTTLSVRKLGVSKSLVFVLLSTSFLIAGCGGKKAKSESKSIVHPQRVVVTQLAEPSSAYLSDSAANINDRSMSAEGWMQIAQTNFQAKRYARSLRAATEALNIEESVEARELAMLSAVKVTESNIDAYRDNTLMSDYDKTQLKTTLADITTLINATE